MRESERFKQDLLKEVDRLQQKLTDLQALRTTSGGMVEPPDQDEDRLRRFVRCTNDGYWEWPDLSQGHQWWSPQLYTLLGYEPGAFEANAQALEEHMHPMDRQILKQMCKAENQVLMPYATDFRLRTRTCKYVWVHSKWMIFEDPDGGRRSLAGAIRDITETKEREMEIWAMKRSLEDSQRIAKMGNWKWYPNSQISWWSDELYRIHGIPLNQQIDYDQYMVQTHPDDREMLEQAISGSLRTGAYECDYRIHRADNHEVRYIHARGEVIFDRRKTPVLHQGIAMDVTELRIAHNKLENLQQNQREMTASMDQVKDRLIELANAIDDTATQKHLLQIISQLPSYAEPVKG